MSVAALAKFRGWSWIPMLGPKAKLLVLDGLVKMTTTSDARESALRSLAVRLYGIWSGDSDPHVQGCVGVLIASIMPVMRKLNYKNFIQGSMNVTLNQLQEAADTAAPNPDEYLAKLVRDRSKSLGKWASECDESLDRENLDVGALTDSRCPQVEVSTVETLAPRHELGKLQAYS